MNRRGKRLMLGVAAMGLAVVVALAIAHWGTVRDNAEAWWFVFRRDTTTLVPEGEDSKASDSWERFVRSYQPEPLYKFQPELFLQAIANNSGSVVVFDPTEWRNLWTIRFRNVATPATLMQANGFRLVEQTFPYPAHVLTGDFSVTR